MCSRCSSIGLSFGTSRRRIYYNKIITFRSPLYPISETIQCLFDDFYQSLVVYRQCGKNWICCSSIFMLVPCGKTWSKRHVKASLEPVWIGASMVFFDGNRWEGIDDVTANDNGLSPNVNLTLRIQDIRIRLVHSESNASVVVGYQLLYQSLRT